MFVPTLTFATLALSVACAIAAPTAPTAATQANIVLVLKFDQNLDLTPGQEAKLEETNIVVTLIDAHGPRAGCHDCPIGATLKVESGSESSELRYSFSGGMLPELLDKAKRKTAFGLVFVAVRVSDAGLTVRVERPKPE